MRHIGGGGEQRKMNFLKQIMCRGTGCPGSGNSLRGLCSFPCWLWWRKKLECWRRASSSNGWVLWSPSVRLRSNVEAAPEQGLQRARAHGQAACWVLGLRGSCRLLGKELLQVCADACQGSCMNCGCSLPTCKFPCAGISVEEGELAIRITQGLKSQYVCTSHPPLQGARPWQQWGWPGEDGETEIVSTVG